MLRKIRLILAIIFFVSVTLLFLDFTGGWHTWMGWMAKIQFLPALLALNVGVVALLVVLTLLFGSHLLLRHLPAGCHAGYCFVGRQSA